MGYRIAITGFVVAAFFLFLGMIAKKPPEQRTLMGVFGILMLIGMAMIPVGVIIGIWE